LRRFSSLRFSAIPAKRAPSPRFAARGSQPEVRSAQPEVRDPSARARFPRDSAAARPNGTDPGGSARSALREALQDRSGSIFWGPLDSGAARAEIVALRRTTRALMFPRGRSLGPRRSPAPPASPALPPFQCSTLTYKMSTLILKYPADCWHERCEWRSHLVYPRPLAADRPANSSR